MGPRTTKLVRIVPDVAAIAAFCLLALFGKLSAEASCGFILAVCAGRLYPTNKRHDDGPPSTPRASVKAPTKAEEDDEVPPSGMATIIFFIVSILTNLTHHKDS